MRRIMKMCVLYCMLAAIVLAGSIARAENGISSTTGLPTDQPYRPVLIPLSNVEGAWPIHGIAAADIVYEAIYWGPYHTRYLAVFQDEHPEKIGSLRDIRVYHAQMRQGWDAPMAYWGGQIEEGTNCDSYFAVHGVPAAFRIDATSISVPVFHREPKMTSPHDAFFQMQTFVESYWPEGENGEPYEPQSPALLFSADAPTQGDTKAMHVALRYDVEGSENPNKYSPSYAYDAATRMYVRSYNGEPQKDGIDDRQVTAANIIVQYCDVSYYENIAFKPLMDTTGEGEMHAYIGGTRIDGTWKRQTDDDPTQYLDAEGNPLVLLPGKTFVQMVPLAFDATQDGDAFSYTWKEGMEPDVRES